jgi:hypothetical protein
MIGIIRRHVVRQKFKKLVAEFDRQIADARAKHLPVKHIERAKSAYVHGLLERRA